MGECLDYKSCKCRKELADELVERSSNKECTENIDEVEIAKITSTELHLARHENLYVCSYIILFVLAVITLAISIGIGAYFAYSHWYLRKDIIVVKFGTRTQWNCIQRSCAQTTT